MQTKATTQLDIINCRTGLNGFNNSPCADSIFLIDPVVGRILELVNRATSDFNFITLRPLPTKQLGLVMPELTTKNLLNEGISVHQKPRGDHDWITTIEVLFIFVIYSYAHTIYLHINGHHLLFFSVHIYYGNKGLQRIY
jgi:hypothetical protein